MDSNGIPWPERFFLLYRQAGIQASREACIGAFYRSEDNLAARFALEGLDLEQTVRLQVACAMEELAPGRADIADRVSRAFVGAARGQLRRNRLLLKKLRRHYKLGVVSNFYGNLAALLAAEGFSDFFNVVADSGKIGIMKPDKGIFLHALERLGASPEEAMLVGDSLERDMRGAEALGMPHAWLASEGPASMRDQIGPCCASGKALRSLDDLPCLLQYSEAHVRL